jgi:hypothetical protein
LKELTRWLSATFAEADAALAAANSTVVVAEEALRDAQRRLAAAGRAAGDCPVCVALQKAVQDAMGTVTRARTAVGVATVALAVAAGVARTACIPPATFTPPCVAAAAVVVALTAALYAANAWLTNAEAALVAARAALAACLKTRRDNGCDVSGVAWRPPVRARPLEAFVLA